jgi:hypothetical protein
MLNNDQYKNILHNNPAENIPKRALPIKVIEEY